MKTRRGFRIKLTTLSELSTFMDQFRSDATRVLARKWAQDVARNAVFNADLAYLGNKPKSRDFISDSCMRLNNNFVEINFRQHNYNCQVDFYFFNGGVFSIFEHGDAAYQNVWKNLKRVEFWGWAADLKKPNNVTSDVWKLREETWKGISSKSRFGQELTFSLFEPPLPKIAWKAIAGCLPSLEERVENCLSAILGEDGQTIETTPEIQKDKLRQHIRNAIPLNISAETLKGEHQKNNNPVQSVKSTIPNLSGNSKPQKAEGKKIENAPKDGKSAYIDHADVILATDGRTFIAVPSVGLAVDTRIFVQVTSRDISFNQNGVNFGTVAGIPQGARDHLKACREAILVEVEKDAEGRLLRAKFIAIVTDITFSEHQNQSLIGFKRPSRTIQAKELEEWDKNLTSQS